MILITVGWSDLLALTNIKLCYQQLPNMLGPKHTHLSEAGFESTLFA